MSSLTIMPGKPEAAVTAEQKAAAPEAARFRFNGILVIAALSMTLAVMTAIECQSVTHLPSLLYGVVLWGWWGCIASVMWELGDRMSAPLSFSAKTISLHVLAGSALGVVHLLLLGSLGFQDKNWAAHSTALGVWTAFLNLNCFGREILIYGFVLGIMGIVQFQLRAQDDAMKSLELQKQLSAAHLRALQMQLEPHFMLNTLNAITTLVELGRQKEAVETLSHLNAILKSTLKRTTPEKVPLFQELEIVENYLAIEQVRFADRLRIEITADPGALDGLVPCFLLQPIVENAIRHGIAHCENEGLVEASARREGDVLRLRVRDSGPGTNGHRQQAGHGIGLKNTRERLAHFYQSGYEMQAQSLNTGGFEVAITIPYERSSR